MGMPLRILALVLLTEKLRESVVKANDSVCACPQGALHGIQLTCLITLTQRRTSQLRRKRQLPQKRVMRPLWLTTARHPFPRIPNPRIPNPRIPWPQVRPLQTLPPLPCRPAPTGTRPDSRACQHPQPRPSRRAVDRLTWNAFGNCE